MQSLWKIPEPVTETPLSRLKEQAQLLSEATKGLLQGEVRANVIGDGRLIITLNIIVPSLNNYRFKILDVSQQPELFPGFVFGGVVNSRREFNDLNEFTVELQNILGAAEMQKIVSGLLAQATSASAA